MILICSLITWIETFWQQVGEYTVPTFDYVNHVCTAVDVSKSPLSFRLPNNDAVYVNFHKEAIKILKLKADSKEIFDIIM